MIRFSNVLLIATLAGSVLAGSLASTNAEEAEKLLEQVAQAYQDAGALSDHVTIAITSPSGTQSYDLDLTFIGQGEGRLGWGGYEFHGVRGDLFIVRDSLPSKYIRKPTDGNFAKAVTEEINGALPVPHFALRQPGTPHQYAGGFGLGQLHDLRADTVQDVTRDGRPMQELNLVGSQGRASAIIDQETNLIHSARIAFGQFKVELTMNPKAYEKMPAPIAFDTASKQEVEILKLEAGDPAPDFELATLEGETVRLSDLAGQMVVIDFWATWCGPCKRGLPEVDKFAKWAATSGHPIKVFGIDSFEKVPTDDLKRASIERYWNSQNFSFPTLIDYTQQTAMNFEVGPIPHSVVIDPEGLIHSVHIGFDPNMLQVLKNEAREIFE